LTTVKLKNLIKIGIISGNNLAKTTTDILHRKEGKCRAQTIPNINI
jgi:hypothetical protein